VNLTQMLAEGLARDMYSARARQDSLTMLPWFRGQFVSSWCRGELHQDCTTARHYCHCGCHYNGMLS